MRVSCSFARTVAHITSIDVHTPGNVQLDMLKISALRPGVVEDWKRRHSTEAIASGDRIISVNGVDNEPAKMLDELRASLCTLPTRPFLLSPHFCPFSPLPRNSCCATWPRHFAVVLSKNLVAPVASGAPTHTPSLTHPPAHPRLHSISAATSTHCHFCRVCEPQVNFANVQFAIHFGIAVS